MGKKKIRGVPDNEWGEVKKDVKITLTPTALKELEDIAFGFGCTSKSELIERIARREIKLVS